MLRIRRFLSLLAVLLAETGIVHAQIPSGAQPGQIERQLQKPPEPRAQPGGVISIPDAGQKPPSNAAQIRFVLKRLDVTGATIYPADTLRAAYESLIGKEVTLAEVYGVAERLTARYRNDGYILSQVVVPAQTVDGGGVRLEAIEGYIADVRVEGVGETTTRTVLAHANKIKAARPLTAAVLERYLLLINDLPGLFARGVLAPAKQPGASDLVIQVTPRVFGAGLTLDNRGSRSLGPRRGLADAEVYYPLGMGARTGVRILATGNGELASTTISHDQWLGSEGLKLGLSYSASRSKPENQTIIALDLETKSDTYSISLSYPVKRSREENFYLRATLGAHDGKTTIFDVRNTEDHVRAVRLGMNYDNADRYAGINTLDVEVSQGINGMGSSANGDAFLSRAKGRVDFTKAVIYAARLQSLGGSWSALAAFNGQYAFSNLLVSELFSFGGEQFGRGHDPSELVGDHGAALKFELRYSGTISQAVYTAYGFYDVGQVRQRDPGGLATTTSAASSGIGLRVGMGRHVSGVVEFAKPLTKLVAQENDNKWRFYGSLSLRF